MFHVLLSSVLNVFIVVVIDYCLTLVFCAFQPMVALINHLLTYLLTYSVSVARRYSAETKTAHSNEEHALLRQ